MAHYEKGFRRMTALISGTASVLALAGASAMNRGHERRR
jgi:hypothetical protein